MLEIENTGPVNIKIADENDLQAMIAVGEKLFDKKIKIERAKEFFNDSRHHLILAYFQDQMVGMASGFHYIHPDKDPELFVNEVGVINEFQNQEIGRKLVMRLCEYGKKFGCKNAWVATDQSNLAARKAFVAAGGKEQKESVILIEFKT